MKDDRGAGTTLWLENRTNHTSETESGAPTYLSKSFKLTPSLSKTIKQALAAHDIKWDELICAAFGLALARLSSTNTIHFGVCKEYKEITKTNIKAQHPINIEYDIKAASTIEKYLGKIGAQFAKNKSNKQVMPRYCILLNQKKSLKKSIDINGDDCSLLLTIDNTKVGNLCLYYASSIEPNDIKCFIEYFTTLLTSFCNQPGHFKLHLLDILPAKQKKKVLRDWVSVTKNYKQKKLTGLFHDIFTQHAKKYSRNIALENNGDTTDYNALLDTVNSLTTDLIRHGIEPGDRVCVLMDRTPALIAAMIAIFKCGAIFIPINPKYPDERVEYVLNDASPKIIITNNAEKVPKEHAKLVYLIESDIHAIAKTKTHIDPPTVSEDDVAYIIYTSGTTGNPKGVMIQHKSLTNFIHWYNICFDISPKDRASQFASQGFDSFFCETIPLLANGAGVYLVDDAIKLTPNLFFDWLSKNAITVVDVTTAYAQILFNITWPENLNVRLLKVGGEAMPHYPDGVFPCDIWNIYGPTEATIEATFKKIYTAGDPSPFIKHKEAPSIGKPLINSLCYIVDEFMQPVPVGVAGELLIGGDNLSPGYLNRDDLTKERFIYLHIEGEKIGPLYRSGDMVKWQDDGEIDFIGRIDHQVKIRGYRIEPSEVEHSIGLHTDVKEVVVVAKNNVNKEINLVAYVVPNLEKERFLFQQRCLISLSKDNFFEAITDDISKGGVSVCGIPDEIEPGMNVMIYIKLPGMSESKVFCANVIWTTDNRCGMKFTTSKADQDAIESSIKYYLKTHNVMDMILSNSTKRSLKRALKKKMPEYMIPSTFVKLLELPLNYNGKIDLKSLPPPQSIDDLYKSNYVPPNSDIEKKLAVIWSDILNKPDISMTDDFFSIGGTSIAAAALSIKILNTFDIIIPVKLLFDLSYIPVLAEYIESNGKQYAESTSIQEDISRDSILSENIHPVEKASKNADKPKYILLTGAGGFLGIYMLRDLLMHSEAKIYCLLRQGDFGTAAEKLQATIDKFNLGEDITLKNKRIILVPSDLSLDRFGLAEDHYSSLTKKIDVIYHCGAQVNIMASYGKLRGSNVQGTIEIIKFATESHNKPIHYISTLSSAYQKNADGELSEEFPSSEFEHLFGGYAISKWVSERLLTQIKNRGLPVTLYRSGYIFGQSDTGITSLNDALLMLIKGCIQLGSAPDLKEKVTMLPVDYVSRAIIAISNTTKTDSDVYHIDHPTGIMWSDLVTWLNEYGYNLKKITLKQWQEKIKQLTPDNALFPFLPYYISLKEDYESDNVNVDKATARLKQIQLPYPKIDDTLLTIYVKYLCQVGFLPRPPKIKRPHELETEKV